MVFCPKDIGTPWWSILFFQPSKNTLVTTAFCPQYFIVRPNLCSDAAVCNQVYTQQPIEAPQQQGQPGLSFKSNDADMQRLHICWFLFCYLLQSQFF